MEKYPWSILYVDPITGAKAKLSDDDFYELSALQSFINTMQNEIGPIDSCPIDITQYCCEDFLDYLVEFDHNNPTRYDRLSTERTSLPSIPLDTTANNNCNVVIS